MTARKIDPGAAPTLAGGGEGRIKPTSDVKSVSESMVEFCYHVTSLTAWGIFRADRGMLIRPDFSNLRTNERALTCCSAVLGSPLGWKPLHAGLASRGEAEAAAI